MTEVRIGHEEREKASALLSDHYASGRLDDDEYAERLDAVWSARTNHDLSVIFHDLPALVRPASTPAQRQGYQRRRPSRAPFLLLLIGLVLLTVMLGIPWWIGLVGGIVLISVTGCATAGRAKQRSARG